MSIYYENRRTTIAVFPCSAKRNEFINQLRPGSGWRQVPVAETVPLSDDCRLRLGFSADDAERLDSLVRCFEGRILGELATPSIRVGSRPGRRFRFGRSSA
jgi:hypothetical protein